MAINTFSVTTSDVSGAVQNLSISASTSPTTVAVTSMISLAAAELERELSVVGIDTQGITDSTSADYILLRQMILYKTIAELLVARERGNPTAGQYYIDRYDRMMEYMRKRPSVASDTGSGPDLMDYIVQDSSTVLDVQFYGTAAGSIVLNGI